MSWTKYRALIRDFLELCKGQSLPLVRPEMEVEEIIQVMACHPKYRLIYVVDEKMHLLGAISLGRLVRHIQAPSREGGVLGRGIIDLATVEQARDLMEKHPLCAKVEEEVGQVVKEMIRHNIKEIPVVDEENRIIGAFTILDLWTGCIDQRSGALEE